MPGSYHRSDGTFTVTGSGDIAPDEPGGAGPGQTLDHTLVGALAGLIAVVVVATMFITAEYRRGLIRTTFAASPRRGRVLAAKAIVGRRGQLRRRAGGRGRCDPAQQPRGCGPTATTCTR